MRKYYKVILVYVSAFVCTFSLQGQTKSIHKDVLLNGREAKLNLATGEFTFKDENGNDSIVSARKKNDKILGQQRDYHTVASGDNLLKISEKYGTTITKIQEANNLETALINVGQKLRVANFEAPKVISTDTIWVVSKGQTLYHISTKTGVSIATIKRLNKLKNNTLFIGQKLNLN